MMNEAGEQEELYSVACMHCGKTVFRFSESFYRHHEWVSLICPDCHGVTEVRGGMYGDGRISAG